MPRLRSSEWLVIGYFGYAAIAGLFFQLSWAPWAMLAAIVAAIVILSTTPFNKPTRLAQRTRGMDVLRDIAPMFYTLAAYREMNWFTPAVRDHRLEQAWIAWDHRLLGDFHARAAIESLGALFPLYLELCYVWVYGIAPVSIGLLFAYHRSKRIDRFWLAYLAGTLGAYALFPYFPSEPPRTLFPYADAPHVMTLVRRFNLWIVGGYGIHSSVFPSAHVSAALSSAWALMATIPERPWIGRMMAIYGASVAIATIYGRYHYAVDAAGGVATSLLAVAALWLSRNR